MILSLSSDIIIGSLSSCIIFKSGRLLEVVSDDMVIVSGIFKSGRLLDAIVESDDIVIGTGEFDGGIIELEGSDEGISSVFAI